MTTSNTTPTAMQRRHTTALLGVDLLALAGVPASVNAQQVVQPKAGAAGQWKLIGQTHADHDTIIVTGSFDNFRNIKFKVTDTPLKALSSARPCLSTC